MKKTYQKPGTQLCLIKVGRMILNASQPNATLNPNADAVDASTIEVRRHHSIWDDDE